MAGNAFSITRSSASPDPSIITMGCFAGTVNWARACPGARVWAVGVRFMGRHCGLRKPPETGLSPFETPRLQAYDCSVASLKSFTGYP
ncbi:alpha amylase catalytic region [Streptomyces laurentii]|uniref:Alpha amylase catalytic region n=1 Tax=Streptomyces laurentii TaxID=39478 RepID=A0A169ND54_STRLU|nr:alpha amylase catalytic region [Streptomyces laurentii]